MSHGLVLSFAVAFVLGGILLFVDECDWGRKNRTHMGVIGTVCIVGVPFAEGLFMHSFLFGLLGLISFMVGVLVTDSVRRLF